MPGAYFATTFAFCFDMREGMLLFSGFMALSAAFWLGSISYTEALWPESDGFRLSSILLLLVNAGLGTAARAILAQLLQPLLPLPARVPAGERAEAAAAAQLAPRRPRQ